MALFTSSQLKGRITITSEDITQLTATYNLNPDAVVSEYADFCEAFSVLDASGHKHDLPSSLIYSPDAPNTSQASQETEAKGSSVATAECTDSTDEEDADYNNRFVKWKQHNFLKPLQICYQLSGYPNLLQLYWILVTLPVTSCSAEVP